MAADFSTATLETKRNSSSAFRSLRGNYFQTNIPYSSKLLSKYEGTREKFSDMQGLKNLHLMHHFSESC